VLEGGRVVERGTHAELLTRGGSYHRLHSLQFRNERERV
jgi:ABC-type multidrug transport system fused ATPase/permease subunit